MFRSLCPLNDDIYRGYTLTKSDKLLQRFLSKPKDLTWHEYVKVFSIFGFELKSGSGSRRSFVNDEGDVFHIHEPHPTNIMKPYTIKSAIEWFTDKGLISLDTGDETDDNPNL